MKEKKSTMCPLINRINFYVKKHDWFRALLLHLVGGSSLKSFMLEHDVKGYEIEVKEALREIRRKSRIKQEYYIQGTSRLRFGYLVLKYRIFKEQPEMNMFNYLLENERK